jgi:hypothetical protein
MRGIAIRFLLLIFCAGCGGSIVYVGKGKTVYQAAQDCQECRREAYEVKKAAATNPNQTHQPVSVKNLLRECMLARGYREFRGSSMFSSGESLPDEVDIVQYMGQGVSVAGSDPNLPRTYIIKGIEILPAP